MEYVIYRSTLNTLVMVNQVKEIMAVKESCVIKHICIFTNFLSPFSRFTQHLIENCFTKKQSDKMGVKLSIS